MSEQPLAREMTRRGLFRSRVDLPGCAYFNALMVLLFVTAVTMACDQPDASRTASPAAPSSSSRPTDPANPGTGLSGSYTLTLVASPSCAAVIDWFSHQPVSFPDSVRVRQYTAEFSGISGTLISSSGDRIPIGGIDHYVYYGLPLLQVTGHDLTIIVPPDADDLARRSDSLWPGGPTCSGGDYWWESVSSTELFDTCGTWRASIDDVTRITGTIDGAFGYYQGDGWDHGGKSVNLFCRAKDHQFTLLKR